MFNFFGKNDSEIKEDVVNEMLWDPSLNNSKVDVSAKDGIITLRGSVPHYCEKKLAEQAAQRVGGVRAVADELEVRGPSDKSDEEIAAAALNALKWNYSVPSGLKVTVDRGWVVLSGDVTWDFERTSAANSVRDLLGVNGVTNDIKMKTTIQSADVQERIVEALRRCAKVEGNDIKVTLSGGCVILSGNVHSYSASEEARLAAWMAPGVMTVRNDLKITQ